VDEVAKPAVDQRGIVSGQKNRTLFLVIQNVRPTKYNNIHLRILIRTKIRTVHSGISALYTIDDFLICTDIHTEET